VENFDEKLTASVLQLSFADLSIDLYASAPDEVEANLTAACNEQVDEDVECTVTGVTAGSLIVDFDLRPNGLTAGAKLLDAIGAANSTHNSFFKACNVKASQLVDIDDSKVKIDPCIGVHCFTGSELGEFLIAAIVGGLLVGCLLACCVRHKKLPTRKKWKCLCQFGFVPRAAVEPSPQPTQGGALRAAASEAPPVFEQQAPQRPPPAQPPSRPAPPRTEF